MYSNSGNNDLSNKLYDFNTNLLTNSSCRELYWDQSHMNNDDVSFQNMGAIYCLAYKAIIAEQFGSTDCYCNSNGWIDDV
jgi:hypothetical protein